MEVFKETIESSINKLNQMRVKGFITYGNGEKLTIERKGKGITYWITDVYKDEEENLIESTRISINR